MKPTVAAILMGIAILIGEYDTGTGTTVCVYAHYGEEIHITIPITKICPETIKL